MFRIIIFLVMNVKSKNFFQTMTCAEYRQAVGLDVPRAPVEKVSHNKYGAQKTEVDGYIFDSKKESAAWIKLRRMEEAGIIKNLVRQTSLDFFIDGKKMFTYKPDMEYDDADGKHHYIDVKGAITAKNPTFRLKKKIIEAYYKITIELL